MTLNSPIYIPSVDVVNKLSGKALFTTDPITLTTLDLIVTDDNSRRVVSCKVTPRFRGRPMILWSGDEYDAIGDYTQAQVEARVLEVLGDNPSEYLVGLIKTS